MLKISNLSLLIFFPIAWFAPLLRAGLLPLFRLDEISTISAIQVLWGADIFLAVLVTFLAIVVPIVKIIATAMTHFGRLSKKSIPTLEILGKLAMADVFLIAIYVIAAKGVGVGRIETAWGLYFFTGCVLASMLITHLTKRQLA